jgi:hypothetical protein
MKSQELQRGRVPAASEPVRNVSGPAGKVVLGAPETSNTLPSSEKLIMKSNPSLTASSTLVLAGSGSHILPSSAGRPLNNSSDKLTESHIKPCVSVTASRILNTDCSLDVVSTDPVIKVPKDESINNTGYDNPFPIPKSFWYTKIRYVLAVHKMQCLALSLPLFLAPTSKRLDANENRSFPIDPASMPGAPCMMEDSMQPPEKSSTRSRWMSSYPSCRRPQNLFLRSVLAFLFARGADAAPTKYASDDAAASFFMGLMMNAVALFPGVASLVGVTEHCLQKRQHRDQSTWPLHVLLVLVLPLCLFALGDDTLEPG